MCMPVLSAFLAVILSTQAGPADNPFGFFCLDGAGDYSGIDLDESWFSNQEINDYYPEGGINKRPLEDESTSSSNIYDTYNANECRRVRKSWNNMDDQERSLYIDGILELRKRGEQNMDLDELVAIASVHDTLFGSVTHHDSDYLFWHGYLVWELESRIRNLGIVHIFILIIINTLHSKYIIDRWKIQMFWNAILGHDKGI